MALGFGYVRDAKPMQINWQDVGEKMSTAIETEIADRESRKADIEKQLTEYNKDLLNQPQGLNAEVNRFMGDFTSDAADAMREAERKLKSGAMSERDFYKFRANANQGTDLMFTAAKVFNEGYDESMNRYAEGKSQAKENWMRQQTEGFMNFANNGAYINPLTGEVNVARRDKVTGEISTKPGDYANASELVQQASAKYNRFDLDAAVTTAVKGLGLRLIKEASGRTTKQFFQALQKGELGKEEQALLDAAKKNMVDAFTVDPNNVSSILTENIGVAENGLAYDFTYDKDEAAKNPNLILVNPDGTNDFSTANGKKQMEAVKKYASARFEAGLAGSVTEPQEMTEQERIENELARRRLDLAERRLNLAERGEDTEEKSTILTDARKYLEDNISLSDIRQEDDVDVIASINDIVAEFGIQIGNPINLIDGQSLLLTQVDDKGNEISEEIFLPSEAAIDFGKDRPSAEASKERIIQFILNNVKLKTLGSLKEKLQGQGQTSTQNNTGGASRFNPTNTQ